MLGLKFYLFLNELGSYVAMASLQLVHSKNDSELLSLSPKVLQSQVCTATPGFGLKNLLNEAEDMREQLM